MKNFIVLLLGIAIGAAAVYFYCCNNELDNGIVEPKGLISPEEAKTLDQAFNSRHRLISDSIVRRPDNRSSWYSLSDMRDYLNYAENEAKGLGYTMDGIRVYLGAYPNEDDKVGYTTMFFVPTGNQYVTEGSMLNISLLSGSPDIKGGSGLNLGGGGNPPEINYPQ